MGRNADVRRSSRGAGATRRTAAAAAALLVAGLFSVPGASAGTTGAPTPTPTRAAAALQFQLAHTWEVPGSLNSGFGVSDAGQTFFYDRVDDQVHRYSPAGKELGRWSVTGTAQGLVVTPQNRVMVLEVGLTGAERDHVRVYDTNGTELFAFDIEDDLVQAAIALALAPNGDVLVASTEEVVRYSADGQKLSDWGDTSGSFTRLSSLAVAPDGQVYVTDEAEHRVKRFDAAGELQGQWGTKGAGRGQFGYPTSVDVDNQGRVHVADPGEFTASRRIQVFDAGGKFLSQIGGPSSFENTPRTVRVDGTGRVFVYDDGHHWGTRIRTFVQKRATPRIVSKQVKVKGRTTKVRLRCTAGVGQCRGTLLLKHRKQTLAKRKFTVRAGKAKTFQVRLTVKGKRILTRQRPKKVRIVANPQGGKKVTKRVRVR